MAKSKDYYATLGVPKTATDKDIKAAYRRLARKYHPDVNAGDKTAEERFKDVAEAFAVLSDPDKRARYDRGGVEAFGPDFDPFAGMRVDFGGGGFGGFADLFDLFTGGGGGRGRGRARPGRGEDLQLEIRIPFPDAILGSTIEIGVPRRVPCPSCDGRGRAPDAEETECPDCHGSGRRSQKRRSATVTMTCPTCGGAGRLRAAPCGSCGGEGTVASTERVKVRIPPGIDDGGRVRVPGKGNSSPNGPAGDAYLHVRVEPHPMFRREGRDLYCDVPVGIARAALGGSLDVPTLDGRARITLPPGTRSGQKLRLKGRGVPATADRAAGDLFVVVQIVPPKSLDARSRDLLEEFERLNPDRT